MTSRKRRLRFKKVPKSHALKSMEDFEAKKGRATPGEAPCFDATKRVRLWGRNNRRRTPPENKESDTC
jgi:hypothetical protein